VTRAWAWEFVPKISETLFVSLAKIPPSPTNESAAFESTAAVEEEKERSGSTTAQVEVAPI
jgi:hypothetical protein